MSTTPAKTVSLTAGKRVLFMTKDPALIRRQLSGELQLRMADLQVADLLDDINTDAMTPAWVCFDWRPSDIARNAYAGLTIDGVRLFPEGALADGNFEVIVSGYRKGVGSSRETAVQAEKWSGIRIAVAASFAPIHARNNINQGVLMADHALLARLQAGEAIALGEFAAGHDPATRKIIEYGGLFAFTKAVARKELELERPPTPARPMTLAEQILARHIVGVEPGPGNTQPFVKPGDDICVAVDGGYSHEFTTAQVHAFLEEEYGANYKLANSAKFAVFEDHLIYADGVPRMAPFSAKIQILRDMQRAFQKKTGVLDYSAVDGISPGICHTIARERIIEPGDFIQATDSHTCMGGALGALAYGVGTTEYAALVHAGFTFVVVPESIRFELTGKLSPGVTAKDVMLYILANHAKRQETLDRVMEFGGPGLATLSPDERATLANMATECAAKAGVCEADEATLDWIVARRPATVRAAMQQKLLRPDAGAEYAGGVHTIDLALIAPMVATANVQRGEVFRRTRTAGALIAELGDVAIDIAYGGSCTAGKEDDIDMYARVLEEAVAADKKDPRRRRVLHSVRLARRRGIRAKARLSADVRAGRRQSHPAGMRRVHRLRPRRVVVDQADQHLGHQPQLPQPLGAPGQLYLASLPISVKQPPQSRVRSFSTKTACSRIKRDERHHDCQWNADRRKRRAARVRHHLRLERARTARQPVRAQDRVPRRDAARRHPVAVGGRSARRGQDQARPPLERRGRGQREHRASRRRPARVRRRRRAGARNPRQQAAHQAVVRCAHAPQRHPSHRRSLAEIGHRHRGDGVHRQLAHSPLRRRVAARPDELQRARGQSATPRKTAYPSPTSPKTPRARGPKCWPRCSAPPSRSGVRGGCVSATPSATPRPTAFAISFASRATSIDSMGAPHPVGIDWHGHNDRGLAVTNTIHALEFGADRAHGTILGVGERVEQRGARSGAGQSSSFWAKLPNTDLSKLLLYAG